jgi:hypothetical protein
LSEDASTVVVLSGNIDVRSIHISFQKLENAFAAALGTGLSLAIDLSQVADADVTLVQLMESGGAGAADSRGASRRGILPRNPVSRSVFVRRRETRCCRRWSAVGFSATHLMNALFSGERNK